MSLYPFLFSLIISLVFSACVPAPQVPLSPELSQYGVAQENCEALSMQLAVPDALEKECRSFLNRLEKANALDYKTAHYNDDNPDPNAKPKPEYILLQTAAYRQHLKSKLEYQEFTDTLNSVSMNAIADDALADVELTLAFPETTFTRQHYLYYKKYAPQFDADPKYLAFEKQYSKELIRKGLLLLSQNDKNGALDFFKEAVTFHNAQAEFLVGIVYESRHIDKAIEWHTKAEQHGVKNSRIHLARLYSRKHEPEESQKWYLRAADDGDAYAQFLLYKKYLKTTSDKTLKIADDWLKNAADNGYPPAEYAYGAQLLKEKKGAEAEAWLLRAKEHGINSANETLGELYFNEKKYKEAYPLLTLAKSANSKYQLAVMFERGLDVIPNYYRAYISYQEAYRLGRKGAKTDMARVGRLKSETEQAHFDAAERIDSAYQKELIERCGEKTTHLNIRTGGERVYLHGLASFPFEGANGFLLHTPEGEVFYVIDTEQQTDIKQFQYVDVSAITTGNALIISGDDDSTLNLYQLYFQKQCQP